MSRPRLVHGSIQLRDGRILLTGGTTYRTFIFIKIPAITSTCEIYNPNNNRFSSARSNPPGVETPACICSVCARTRAFTAFWNTYTQS